MNLHLALPGWILGVSFLGFAIGTGVLIFLANLANGYDKDRGEVVAFLAGGTAGVAAVLALLLVAAVTGWHGIG